MKRRLLSGVLAAVYLLSNGVFAHAQESNMWEERRRRLEKNNDGALLAGLPGGAGTEDILHGLPPPRPDALTPALSSGVPSSSLAGPGAELLRALPAQFGSIRKVIPSSGPSKGIVIHIQDVHQNAQAQKNIADAVRALTSSTGAGDLVVALEGAFGPVDVSRFRRFAGQPALRRVADYLLKECRIPGPVHAALTGPAEARFIGIDDPSHYDDNVEAYRRSAPRQTAEKSRLAEIRTALGAKKAAAFNASLKEFDGKVAAYRAGALSLGDYVGSLASIAGVPDKDVRAFLQALELERSLDFREVEAERTRLVEGLVHALSPPQLEDLLRRSADYRLGRVRYADFYRSLQALCGSAGLPMSRFPAMDAYVRYVLLSDRVDPENLFHDVTALEARAYGLLARTPEEKRLVAESASLHLTGKLVDFSLTPEEWDAYTAARRPGENTDLASFESFYVEARARDAAMAANLLGAMASRGAAVLVTGGFHAEGVAARLAKAGLTVVEFTPRIDKVDLENASAYLSVFTREKSPLDKLFEGRKLFLAERVLPPAQTVEIAADVVTAEEAGDPAHSLEDPTGELRSLLPDETAATLSQTTEDVPGGARGRLTLEGRGAVDISVQSGAGGEIAKITSPASVHPGWLSSLLSSFQRKVNPPPPNPWTDWIARHLQEGSADLKHRSLLHGFIRTFFTGDRENFNDVPLSILPLLDKRPKDPSDLETASLAGLKELRNAWDKFGLETLHGPLDDHLVYALFEHTHFLRGDVAPEEQELVDEAHLIAPLLGTRGLAVLVLCLSSHLTAAPFAIHPPETLKGKGGVYTDGELLDYFVPLLAERLKASSGPERELASWALASALRPDIYEFGADSLAAHKDLNYVRTRDLGLDYRAKVLTSLTERLGPEGTVSLLEEIREKMKTGWGENVRSPLTNIDDAHGKPYFFTHMNNVIFPKDHVFRPPRPDTLPGPDSAGDPVHVSLLKDPPFKTGLNGRSFSADLYDRALRQDIRDTLSGAGAAAATFPSTYRWARRFLKARYHAGRLLAKAFRRELAPPYDQWVKSYTRMNIFWSVDEWTRQVFAPRWENLAVLLLPLELLVRMHPNQPAYKIRRVLRRIRADSQEEAVLGADWGVLTAILGTVASLYVPGLPQWIHLHGSLWITIMTVLLFLPVFLFASRAQIASHERSRLDFQRRPWWKDLPGNLDVSDPPEVDFDRADVELFSGMGTGMTAPQGAYVEISSAKVRGIVHAWSSTPEGPRERLYALVPTAELSGAPRKGTRDTPYPVTWLPPDVDRFTIDRLNPVTGALEEFQSVSIHRTPPSPKAASGEPWLEWLEKNRALLSSPDNARSRFLSYAFIQSLFQRDWREEVMKNLRFDHMARAADMIKNMDSLPKGDIPGQAGLDLIIPRLRALWDEAGLRERHLPLEFWLQKAASHLQSPSSYWKNVQRIPSFGPRAVLYAVLELTGHVREVVRHPIERFATGREGFVDSEAMIFLLPRLIDDFFTRFQDVRDPEDPRWKERKAVLFTIARALHPAVTMDAIAEHLYDRHYGYRERLIRTLKSMVRPDAPERLDRLLAEIEGEPDYLPYRSPFLHDKGRTGNFPDDGPLLMDFILDKRPASELQAYSTRQGGHGDFAFRDLVWGTDITAGWGWDEIDLDEYSPDSYRQQKAFLAAIRRDRASLAPLISRAEAIPVASAAESSFQPASIADKAMRTRGFNVRHPVLYVVYSIVGVHWEAIFQAPVWLALKHFSPGWAAPAAALAVIASAGLFALAHRGARAKERMALFAVGVVLGGVFLLPGVGWAALGWRSILVSMGLHGAYNALALWTRRNKPFTSEKDVEGSAPRRILSALKEAGLSRAQLSGARRLMDLTGTLYKRMGLSTEFYHNHVHNLGVTLGALTLAKAHGNAWPESAADMFLAALLHDFHIRPAGKPANVEETLAQLRVILGLSRVGAVLPGSLKFRDEKLFTSGERSQFQGAFRDLSGAREMDRTFSLVETLIRRTDYPSDVDPTLIPPDIKPLAARTREETDRMADNGHIHSADLKPLIDRLKASRRIGGDDAAMAVNRVIDIELDYLALLRDKAAGAVERAALHKNATLLDKGADQGGSFWLNSPEVNRRVKQGLFQELKINVSADYDDYSRFTKPVILSDATLKVLAPLPLPYRLNFLNVVEDVAARSGREKDWRGDEPRVLQALRIPRWAATLRRRGLAGLLIRGLPLAAIKRKGPSKGGKPRATKKAAKTDDAELFRIFKEFAWNLDEFDVVEIAEFDRGPFILGRLAQVDPRFENNRLDWPTFIDKFLESEGLSRQQRDILKNWRHLRGALENTLRGQEGSDHDFEHLARKIAILRAQAESFPADPGRSAWKDVFRESLNDLSNKMVVEGRKHWEEGRGSHAESILRAALLITPHEETRVFLETVKADPVLQILKDDYHADKDKGFRYPNWETLPAPEQGWKLQISGGIARLPEVLRIVLPILKREKVDHKVINGLADRETILAGKTVTVYPPTYVLGVQVARALDEALRNRGFTGQKVDGYNPFGLSGLIHYRYGTNAMLEGLKDRTFIDPRTGRYVKDDLKDPNPFNLKDPFAEASLEVPVTEQGPTGLGPSQGLGLELTAAPAEDGWKSGRRVITPNGPGEIVAVETVLLRKETLMKVTVRLDKKAPEEKTITVSFIGPSVNKLRHEESETSSPLLDIFEQLHQTKLPTTESVLGLGQQMWMESFSNTYQNLDGAGLADRLDILLDRIIKGGDRTPAHGLSTDEGGIDYLLQVLVEGSIKSPENFSLLGPLSKQETPYFLVFSEKVFEGDGHAAGWAAYIRNPNNPHTFMLSKKLSLLRDLLHIVVPTDQDRAYLMTGLSLAEEKGLISYTGQAETSAKIVTYQDYLAKKGPSFGMIPGVTRRFLPSFLRAFGVRWGLALYEIIGAGLVEGSKFLAAPLAIAARAAGHSPAAGLTAFAASLLLAQTVFYFSHPKNARGPILAAITFAPAAVLPLVLHVAGFGLPGIVLALLVNDLLIHGPGNLFARLSLTKEERAGRALAAAEFARGRGVSVKDSDLAALVKDLFPPPERWTAGLRKEDLRPDARQARFVDAYRRFRDQLFNGAPSGARERNLLGRVLRAASPAADLRPAIRASLDDKDALVILADAYRQKSLDAIVRAGVEEAKAKGKPVFWAAENAALKRRLEAMLARLGVQLDVPLLREGIDFRRGADGEAVLYAAGLERATAAQRAGVSVSAVGLLASEEWDLDRSGAGDLFHDAEILLLDRFLRVVKTDWRAVENAARFASIIAAMA